MTHTTSLPAAAFAIAAGNLPLPELKAIGEGRFAFNFSDPDGKASELIIQYFTGAPVSARDYYRALQDIRGMMNRTKNGGAR